MLNSNQFREDLVRSTLQSIQMWSEEAENLLMGTALVESSLVYLKQIGGGPAVSLFMIEPATYLDLRQRLITDHNDIYKKILGILAFMTLPMTADFLIGNITAAIIMARIKYFFDSQPIPDATDYMGLALYHKRVYNTAGGATDINASSNIFKEVCIYQF